MRIKKGESVLLTAAANRRFLMVIDCLTDPVTVTRGADTLIRISLTESEGVLAEVLFSDGRHTRLRGERAKGREIILTQGDAHIVLYVDGVLSDEDFFFAPVDYEGATLTAGSFSHFEAGYLYHSMWESAVGGVRFPSLDALAPLGRDNRLTACFNAKVADRTHVFYLVKSEGEEKCGKGAVRLFHAHLTEDGSVVSLPIALTIDEIAEREVVDAALLWHEGRGYLYYIMEREEGRRLTCAVSEDGYSFVKTGLDVEIPGVDNGLVSTVSVVPGEVPCLYLTADGKRVFAESEDLLHFKEARLCSDGKNEG